MNRKKLIIGATALSILAAIGFPVIVWANRANLLTELSTQALPAATSISVQAEAAQVRKGSGCVI